MLLTLPSLAERLGQVTEGVNYFRSRNSMPKMHNELQEQQTVR